MYADTDFFLALMKNKNWLKRRAEELYNTYEGEISTSGVTLVELLLLSSRYKLDPERLITDCLQLVEDIKGLPPKKALLAAHYMKEKNFSVFDAFHGAFAEEEIISSDKIYEKIGLKRIKLEEDADSGAEKCHRNG